MKTKRLLILGFILIIYTGHAQTFHSNNTELNESFVWARNKALSFAHNSGDPVGMWYEAALPNREAFCMRDVSHQALGAEILGLGKHNLNMFIKFASNISTQRDYCSYWEINRYNKPAPVDYTSDKDFWYNLPANFDIVYNAYRLYEWTGDVTYLNHPAFRNFYSLSMNEYVHHWQLGYDQVLGRKRELHNEASKRFGINRGIPTYNEGGRGETKLGIDMTASLVAAYRAYAAILNLTHRENEALIMEERARRTAQILEYFWWDQQKKEYKSVQYMDGTFDYFMVGDNQAFLQYPIYFGAFQDPSRIRQIVDTYREKYPQIIVELKSYLPIIFFENGESSLASRMIIELCQPDNKRRDYPENSFTIMEHITRGLMGINVMASTNTISTQSRLAQREDWAELNDVPALGGKISVRHDGAGTTFTNHLQKPVNWKAIIAGQHDYLVVNGTKTRTEHDENGNAFVVLTIGSHQTGKVAIAE
ncbi:MAG TPA: hypothetical protein PK059_10765 [Cyclobacteriaceae bacterium]|nr:hypothetical protein [Cyclobacteriaceae bacterium]